jgi:hypothetical protein
MENETSRNTTRVIEKDGSPNNSEESKCDSKELEFHSEGESSNIIIPSTNSSSEPNKTSSEPSNKKPNEDKYIYFLELESEKYYVGKTTNPDVRIDNHTNGASHWTMVYKPRKIIDIIPNCDDYDEDKYTLKYMNQYGIDNVRGGSFCEVVLSQEKIKIITQMLNSANGKCYKCGGIGHFAKNCRNGISTNKCERCHRLGHPSNKCYAKTFVDGKPINPNKITTENLSKDYPCTYCGKTFTTLKGARYHENIYCQTKKRA